MEYAALVLASTARHLQQLFKTDFTQPHTTRQQLEHELAQVVHHHLHHDLPRLLHILYRIDVDERQVKQAMLAPTKDAAALHIARLIIKRELQKAQTRFMYGSN